MWGKTFKGKYVWVPVMGHQIILYNFPYFPENWKWDSLHRLICSQMDKTRFFYRQTLQFFHWTLPYLKPCLFLMPGFCCNFTLFLELHLFSAVGHKLKFWSCFRARSKINAVIFRRRALRNSSYFCFYL